MTRQSYIRLYPFRFETPGQSRGPFYFPVYRTTNAVCGGEGIKHLFQGGRNGSLIDPEILKQGEVLFTERSTFSSK